MGTRPAVFVDRDGTMMVERSYLADPAGVRLVPGAVEGMALLRRAGFALVTVTNQSGIARGLYTEDDYHAVAGRLNEVLDAAGVPVDGTEHCPHHPEVTGPCMCRKPSTGLYLRASTILDLDPARSYYVGDKVTDVAPALELRGQGILVRTGYGIEHEARIPRGTWVADDLRQAADLIVEASGPLTSRADLG